MRKATTKPSIGKPSRACHACRTAGISCDRRARGCTPCQLAGKECPGYIKPGELVFLNQNEFASKASFRARNRKTVKNVALLGSESDVLAPRSLWGTSQEDHAICYFLATHVASTGRHGFLDMLPEMYKTKDKLLPLHLKSCIEALAFASYAARSQDSYLARLAGEKYSVALRLTNNAIQDGKTALLDNTLFTVSMLRMYETMTGNDRRSLAATHEHVRGSAVLVGLRGTKQLENPFARRMFVQSVMITTIHCIDVPEDVLAMCRQLQQFLDPTDATMQLFRLVLGAHELQMGLRKNPNVANPRLIALAFQLDGVLSYFCRNPPAGWHYKIRRITDTTLTVFFRDTYHVFADLGIASVWHVIWLMRMRIHICVRQMMQAKYEEDDPPLPDRAVQLETSLQICRQMQANVLSSVPQFLGYVQRVQPPADLAKMSKLDAFDRVSPSPTPSPRTTPEQESAHKSPEHKEEAPPKLSPPDPPPNLSHRINEVPLIRPFTGHMLIWPLWFASSVEEAEEDTRSYAMGILTTIAISMGVGQAHVLAEALRSYTPAENADFLQSSR